MAETKRLVYEHAREVCPISPCKRDAVSRHVGPRVCETRQVCICHIEHTEPFSQLKASDGATHCAHTGTHIAISSAHTVCTLHGGTSWEVGEEPVSRARAR